VALLVRKQSANPTPPFFGAESCRIRHEEKDMRRQLATPLEVVKHVYNRFAEGDIDGFLALCADNIEWVVNGPANLEKCRAFKGHGPRSPGRVGVQLICSADVRRRRENGSGTGRGNRYRQDIGHTV
jgi:hypothetical protein